MGIVTTGKMHHITNDIAVLDNSIIRTGIVGIGRDRNGYIRNDGWRIEICAGLQLDGTIYLWAAHGGGDSPLDDDDRAIAQWCYSMGDDDKSVHTSCAQTYRDRVAQGARRIVDACDYISQVLKSSDIASQLDWYRDCQFRAQAWAADDRNLESEGVEIDSECDESEPLLPSI